MTYFNLGFVDRNVPGGTHILMLYDYLEELSDILPLFFGGGLMQKEAVVIIYPNSQVKEKIREGLRELVDLDKYEADHKIIYYHYRKAYYDGGEINPRKLYRIIYRNIAESYMDVDGIRVAGDMSWITETEFTNIVKVAKGVKEKIEKKEIIILNTFPVNLIKPCEMIELIQSYTILLYKKDDKWLLSEAKERTITQTELDKLEIFTKFAVDREKKITELKDKIRELEESQKI